MKLIELVVSEDSDLDPVEAISLVDHPAIEANFVALSKEQQKFKLASEERRVILGPAMIPDKPIYRKQDEEEFYIWFSKRTIRRAMELYMRNTSQHSSTLQHMAPIKGVYTIESWIVESEQDKSRQYNMPVPMGTWMVAQKIENDSIWEEFVKTGAVRGFSIEGYFIDRAQALAAHPEDELLEELESLCKELNPNPVN